MYRVYILLLLAIGFSAFAVDSFQSILQAKKITDTSMTLSWTEIPEAQKYKIFYDESDLLDPNSPNPLLDTDFITWTQGDITKMTPATQYTLIVHAFDEEWQDIGKSLPLHAKTYPAPPQMNLSQDPLTSNETTIELAFTRPVDSKNAQVILKNPKTKKNLPIQGIVSSPEDLRVILVQLKEKMELTVPYELTLQKIVSLDGVELPPENRIPLKVVYNGVLPPLTSITNDNAAPSVALDDTSDELDSGFTEPVPIDHLPQTGPRSILFIALLSAFIVFLIQKKLSKRA